MHYEEIEYRLSEQRLANLKMSIVWARCNIEIKHILTPRCKKESSISTSLTQHGGLSGMSINEKRRDPNVYFITGTGSVFNEACAKEVYL